MHPALIAPIATTTMTERRREAADHNRTARVLTARRLQKRAEAASRRARLARLAIS